MNELITEIVTDKLTIEFKNVSKIYDMGTVQVHALREVNSALNP